MTIRARLRQGEGWLCRVRVPLVLGLTLAIAFSLFAAPPLAPAKKSFTPPDFNLIAAGDAITVTSLTARKSDPGFMGVVNVLRKADAAVLNFEGTFAGKEAYPAADTAGTWIASVPERLKDLKWAGFNLFSAANNHSVDFGALGVLDTIRTFVRADAVYAGIGEDLGEARAADYLTTTHGRIALVSCTSTFRPDSPAGQARPDMRGRPGASTLRHESIYSVDATGLQTLREVWAKGFPAWGRTASLSGNTLSFQLQGEGPIIFDLARKPGLVTTPDPRDMVAITDEIRDAKEMADYVVVYMHAHEQDPSSVEVPAQFVIKFAHAAIDAGADVFASSGPHLLRGIEIYKGKVILYSLGNFIFENDLVVPQPSDVYEQYNLGLNALPARLFDARSDYDTKWWPADPRDWESVLANVTFHNGVPKEVTLTPIELGYGNRRPDRGIPRLADPVMSASILEHLQKLSQPFGTDIIIRNGVGTVAIESEHPME